MKTYIAAALALLMLSACTSQRLGESKGPIFDLNPGLWQPTPEDLGGGR